MEKYISIAASIFIGVMIAMSITHFLTIPPRKKYWYISYQFVSTGAAGFGCMVQIGGEVDFSKAKKFQKEQGVDIVILNVMEISKEQAKQAAENPNDVK